ncbi:hypothetical protein [Pseudarthrobacter sp. DSP2-3-2b1]|uniref:hypothetical protein n=1 Tax=Pseudarthrobacter sp. DSP2-3-2b1 TaxID=2804661 RepID=UPI003CF8ED5D
MSSQKLNGIKNVGLPSFLGAVVIATFLGALIVVTGSSASRSTPMTWDETFMAVAEAGFRGSIVAIVAAVLIWFPTYRYVSRNLRLALQLPAMMISGGATALPVAIVDTAFDLNPGFTGIWAIYAFFAGIWSASLAWVQVTVFSSRTNKLSYVRWIGFLVLAVGAVMYGFRTMGAYFGP